MPPEVAWSGVIRKRETKPAAVVFANETIAIGPPLYILNTEEVGEISRLEHVESPVGGTVAEAA